MAAQPRSRRSDPQQDALDLLQKLIDTPPAPRADHLVPVSLRSVSQQRQHVLRSFLRRTWVDYALTHTERLLMLAAFVVFGVWLADGPLYDWWHAQHAPAPVAVVAAAPASASRTLPAPRADAAALLPYTSPSAPEAADDSFLAPRAGAPVAPLVPSAQPTRLLAPAMMIDTPVKEVFVVNSVWQVAEYAAGYMHGTALPGDTGNTVLAGHAGLRGGVFRNLGQFAAGDDIYLDSGGWRFHYRVRETKSVWPDQVEVLDPTTTPQLTLITCTNWDTQRLVVVATLLDSKPTPGA